MFNPGRQPRWPDVAALQIETPPWHWLHPGPSRVGDPSWYQEATWKSRGILGLPMASEGHVGFWEENC